jgi:arginase
MAKIRFIGVPMDLGASRRGVDMGPSALRIARVGQRLQSLGHEVSDFGNVSVKVAETMLEEVASKNHFLFEIADTCSKLADAVYETFTDGKTPLVVGGDHSIAVGTVAGVNRFFHEKKKKVGLIWLDAHADINTPESSLSGNVHGMPVAHILGRGAPELLRLGATTPMVDPKNIVQIGIRDLDPIEQVHVKESGIRAFTMRHIDEMGLRRVMEEAIAYASDGTEGFHVSMDVDWLDPSEAPGVGTPVHGGATYREGHLAMEMICDSKKMLSLEVTEVNPVLDHENETAIVAMEMILSAFGKKIL